MLPTMDPCMSTQRQLPSQCQAPTAMGATCHNTWPIWATAINRPMCITLRSSWMSIKMFIQMFIKMCNLHLKLMVMANLLMGEPSMSKDVKRDVTMMAAWTLWLEPQRMLSNTGLVRMVVSGATVLHTQWLGNNNRTDIRITAKDSESPSHSCSPTHTISCRLIHGITLLVWNKHKVACTTLAPDTGSPWSRTDAPTTRQTRMRSVGNCRARRAQKIWTDQRTGMSAVSSEWLLRWARPHHASCATSAPSLGTPSWRHAISRPSRRFPSLQSYRSACSTWMRESDSTIRIHLIQCYLRQPTTRPINGSFNPSHQQKLKINRLTWPNTIETKFWTTNQLKSSSLSAMSLVTPQRNRNDPAAKCHRRSPMGMSVASWERGPTSKLRSSWEWEIQSENPNLRALNQRVAVELRSSQKWLNLCKCLSRWHLLSTKEEYLAKRQSVTARNLVRVTVTAPTRLPRPRLPPQSKWSKKTFPTWPCCKSKFRRDWDVEEVFKFLDDASS